MDLIKIQKKKRLLYLPSNLSTYAGYITINISSPNTEGLRDFHDQQEFEKLLTGINKIKKDKNILKPMQ